MREAPPRPLRPLIVPNGGAQWRSRSGFLLSGKKGLDGRGLRKTKEDIMDRLILAPELRSFSEAQLLALLGAIDRWIAPRSARSTAAARGTFSR